uniref:Peptidase M24 domain-containing protein n=1 Tax=Chloropicon primus TaxID=1764295 RepID=A0A7S2SZ76_9CHLO
MRASAEITTGAFNQCMALSHPSMNERQLSSLFEFLCKQEGAQRMPYPQVVAGGNNACTIHYSSNNRRVFGGELVLMDAGCDFYGYVSDVTRTWPVSGKFTEPQREVYEHVLEAHRECVEVCVEGNTLRDIHKMSVHLLSRALSKLGIVQKSTQQIILRGLYKPYYPHSIGHWLGMDTHDVHTVSALRPFEEGVVLTIEPGLYLPRNVHDIPAQYRGIGIRLEDDVLVRGGGLGPEVLSGNVPISPEDVEDLVGTWMDQEHQPAPEGEDQVDLTSASSLVGQQGSEDEDEGDDDDEDDEENDSRPRGDGLAHFEVQVVWHQEGGPLGFLASREGKGRRGPSSGLAGLRRSKEWEEVLLQRDHGQDAMGEAWLGGRQPRAE